MTTVQWNTVPEQLNTKQVQKQASFIGFKRLASLVRSLLYALFIPCPGGPL